MPPDRIVHWLPADPPAAGRRCTASQTAGRRARVACTSVRVQATRTTGWRPPTGERRAGVDSPLVAGVKVAGSVATASRPPDSDMPVTFGLDSSSNWDDRVEGLLGPRPGPRAMARLAGSGRGAWKGLEPAKASGRGDRRLRIEGGRLVTAGPRETGDPCGRDRSGPIASRHASSIPTASGHQLNSLVTSPGFARGRMYRSTQDRTNPRSRRSSLATSSPGRRPRQGPGP